MQKKCDSPVDFTLDNIMTGSIHKKWEQKEPTWSVSLFVLSCGMQYDCSSKNCNKATYFRSYAACILTWPILKRQIHTAIVLPTWNNPDKSERAARWLAKQPYLEHYCTCSNSQGCKHHVIYWRYNCCIKGIKCLQGTHQRK